MRRLIDENGEAILLESNTSLVDLGLISLTLLMKALI